MWFALIVDELLPAPDALASPMNIKILINLTSE